MDHLWLLTEERPKPSVVLQIIKMYCKDFDDRITLHHEIKILPHIKDGVFQFVYEVEGLKGFEGRYDFHKDRQRKLKLLRLSAV